MNVMFVNLGFILELSLLSILKFYIWMKLMRKLLIILDLLLIFMRIIFCVRNVVRIFLMKMNRLFI